MKRLALSLMVMCVVALPTMGQATPSQVRGNPPVNSSRSNIRNNPNSGGTAKADARLNSELENVTAALIAIHGNKSVRSRMLKLVSANDRVGVAKLLISQGAPKNLSVRGFSRRGGLPVIHQPPPGPAAYWVQVGVVTNCGSIPCVKWYWAWFAD
jgi:hypothetical protein